MAGPNVTEKCSNGRCEIPAGSFQMGSTEGDPDEQPVRTVAMTGFQLGQMEVSVDDYQAYLVGTAGVQLSAVIAGCGTSGTSRTIAAHKGETKGQLRERAAQMVVGESCNVMQVVESTPSGMPDFPENKKGGNYPVVALTMDEKRAYCQAQGGDLPTAAQLHYASRFDDQDSATGDLVISDHVFRSDDGFRSAEPVNGGYKDRFGVYNLFGNVWESTLEQSIDQSLVAIEP
ncbi:MAG: SUMF1/EgtB/PvdO family nonheme iron enzyme [Deltaproteobacteria bacterium]|nr:SUMF1/EgtB/PvdO family nonheme iron enzyme [Deltaproteobacteria bacterium]